MSARLIASPTTLLIAREGAQRSMPLALRHSFMVQASMMACLHYQGDCFTHALCNVHNLCELTIVEEELMQVWTSKMKELLLDMKAEVEQARVLGQHELDALLLTCLPRRYDSILVVGYQANPPPAATNKSEQSKRTPRRPKHHPARNLLNRSPRAN
jgi:hypothetical protein